MEEIYDLYLYLPRCSLDYEPKLQKDQKKKKNDLVTSNGFLRMRMIAL